MIYKFQPFQFFKDNKIVIDSVLDIGSHKGEWIKRFREHFPHVKFFMIEANANHLEELRKIGTCINALVGKYNQDVSYYECEDKDNDHGNGMYKENTNVPFKATTRRSRTLDYLLPGQKFDLIKMDVQGAELDIIQGSPGIIHNTKYLWLELQAHQYNIGAPLAGKVIGYLHEIGFEMIAIDEINTGNGVIMGMDVIFVNVRNKELGTGFDINKKLVWGAYPQ